MKKTSPFAVTSEETAQRAHDIWEQLGRPDGQATDHWLRAERELQGERGQAEQFEKGMRGSRARNEAGRAVQTAGGY